jgi:hypothetical protein
VAFCSGAAPPFELSEQSRAKEPTVKFTYARAGQEPLTFDFDPNELGTLEAELIEEAGGTQWRSFGQWVDLHNQGGFRAWRVSLWIMLRRQNPSLAFEEVLPTVGELIIGIDDTETPAEPSEDEPSEGKDEPGDDATDSP